MKAIHKTMLVILALVLANCSKNDDAQTPMVIQSDAKKITLFKFDALANTTLANDVTATIDESAKTITATVPFGTDITSLDPEIGFSPKATVSPTGARDFSNAVSYTITAEDGSSSEYSVSVVVAKRTEKQVITFVFKAADNAALTEDITAIIDEENKTVAATVPNNTDLTSLVPIIEVSAGATISPQDVQDFTSPKVYTVTAEDDSTADYTVTITVLESDEKQLLTMVFAAVDNDELIQNVTFSINENQKTATAEVPFGTDVSALRPSIEVSLEATVSPDGPQDFSNPVIYTVTAENGDQAPYEITVNIKPPATGKQIFEFKFLASRNSVLSEDVTAAIDENAKSIVALVPRGTNRGRLVPTIAVSSRASISPTGAQNFNNLRVYTITAEDGSSATYEVKVERLEF